MQEIREWREVDAETFWRDIKPLGEPAVLRGKVGHWPVVDAGRRGPQALADYLRPFHTRIPAPFFEGPPEIGGRFFYDAAMTGFNFQARREVLDKALDRLLQHLDDPSPPAMYAGSLSIPIFLPGFAALNPLGVFEPEVSVIESAWLGNRTVIAAHFDSTENIACVAGGRRRFTVFPADQVRNLYMGPIDLTPAGQPISLVDIRNPDFARHPRYAEAQATGQVAELEPGDAIYIPALWWHSVEALEPLNLLINYWWRDTPAHLGSPMDALLAAALSLKDLPPHHRRGWKALFDHLIFQEDGPPLTHLSAEVQGLLGTLTPDRAARIRAILTRNLAR